MTRVWLKVACVSALALLILATGPVAASAASNVLTWIDNSDNETAFHIERKVEACAGLGTFAEIATTGANIVTFTDAAISEGLTYCYRVAASNAAGQSAYSNTADRTVPRVRPARPTGLKIIGGV